MYVVLTSCVCALHIHVVCMYDVIMVHVLVVAVPIVDESSSCICLVIPVEIVQSEQRV